MDEFVFELNQQEFLDFMFEDLELPNLVRKQLKDSDSYKLVKGGYLREGIPQNPLNGLETVRIVKGRPLSAEIDGETGWIYDPVADELSLNAPGQWGAYRGQTPRF